jgi:hypothetical protein
VEAALVLLDLADRSLQAHSRPRPLQLERPDLVVVEGALDEPPADRLARDAREPREAVAEQCTGTRVAGMDDEPLVAVERVAKRRADRGKATSAR